MNPIHLQADNSDGWGEWSRHVLKTLEDQGLDIRDIRNSIALIQTEIAVLKVKSGIWGAMGGMIPVLIAVVLFWMERK